MDLVHAPRRRSPPAGEDPALAESHFPDGPAGAVAAWADLADRDMEAAAAATEMATLRTPERIRRAVELRLAAAAPHKRALRRALSVLALPWNAGLALRTASRTASAIWYAAGDSSADFSWYTRRASLGAIYAATLGLLAAGRRSRNGGRHGLLRPPARRSRAVATTPRRRRRSAGGVARMRGGRAGSRRQPLVYGGSDSRGECV